MKTFFLIFSVIGLSLSLAQGLPALAAAKKFQSTNWVAACKKAKNGKNLCQMTRAIRQVGAKQPLLVAAVQRDVKKKAYTLVLRLPHGLNLPLGIQLQIDKKKARRIAVLSSDRSGAITRINLSDKVLATLKKGKHLKIAFITVAGQRYNIPVSLSGFTAVFSQLGKKR